LKAQDGVVFEMVEDMTSYLRRTSHMF